MDICIKNVNKEDWLSFKSESAMHEMKAGEFLGKIVKEHKLKCKDGNWDNVLHGEKNLKGILTRRDAKELRETFREEFSLR